MSRSKDGAWPGIMATVALSLLGCVVVILVILLCITAITALSGCTTHPRKPEPKATPAFKAVVRQLVYMIDLAEMKSDPNVFKIKELKPSKEK